MEIHRAYARTRNFEFEGFGVTKDDARGNLFAALEKHAGQYGLRPDWHEGIIYPEFYIYETDRGYRDGEAL